MMVPKRRPPRPHSCSRSRSPLRQCAAAKPSQVMSPNSTTRMISAVQSMIIALRVPLPVGGEIDDRGEDRAEDHPQQLVPVEERQPDPGGLDLVVEWRPQRD